MKLSTNVKPISYLKSHTAEIVKEITETREPLLITQNGVSSLVVQDVASYEQTQQTIALLKIIAIGRKQIEQGQVKPMSEVFSALE
jgi:prevent-host-death family protein